MAKVQEDLARNRIWWGCLIAANAAALVLAGPAAVWTISIAATLLVLVAAANFVIDPYQRYRRPSWYRPLYSRSRYLNPGLARTRDYDTVLLGSSVIGDMPSRLVDRLLGGTCLKLPMAGPSAREFGLLLGAVLRVGKARRVILALDPFVCRGGTERLGNRIPVILYGPDGLADLRYLTGFDTLASAVRAVRRSRASGDRREFDIDRYGASDDDGSFSCEAVAAHWKAGAPTRVTLPEDHRAPLLERNARTHLLPLFQRYPDVEFYIYFPPYSALAWADNARKGVLEDALAFRAFFFDATRRLGNVRLFDFQAETAIVTDLRRYRDLIHYSPAVNEWILRRMAAGEGRLTSDALRTAESRLRTLASAFSAEYGYEDPERCQTLTGTETRGSHAEALP